MLKRLLASLSLVSLLIAVALLVYWWRSNHGHVDSFLLGSVASTQTRFTSAAGHVGVEVIEHQGAIVTSRLQFYTFKQCLGYTLLIPGLWVAIKVRNMLPRPPGRQLRR